MSREPLSSRRPGRALRLVAVLGTLCLALAALTAAPATATQRAAARARAAPPGAQVPDLGSRVVVFDPSMPVAEIKAQADAIHARQVDDEMGTERWSLLFRPGTYGTDAEPLQIKVGYYTEVAGLGASPRTP